MQGPEASPKTMWSYCCVTVSPRAVLYNAKMSPSFCDVSWRLKQCLHCPYVTPERRFCFRRAEGCACCWQVKDAMAAVALLHNHVLQQEDAPGAAPVTKAKGKKPQEAQAPVEGLLLWARQVSGEGAHLKKWRLILRNLPFNVRTATCSAHTSVSCTCCLSRL